MGVIFENTICNQNEPKKKTQQTKQKSKLTDWLVQHELFESTSLRWTYHLKGCKHFLNTNTLETSIEISVPEGLSALSVPPREDGDVFDPQI